SQGLQFRAQFNRASLLDVESIVVEEKFLHVRPMLFGLCHLTRNVITRSFAPGMSTERLRPQAESALGRAATGGVQGYVRMKQERHVVTGNVQIALVNVSHVRQSVEILNLRAVGIVDDSAVLAIRHA